MSKAIDMNKPKTKTISLTDFANKTGMTITHVDAETVKEFAQKNKEAKQKRIERKIERKKAVPVPKADQDKPEYDCDDLIAKAEARRLKAQERAKLPQKSEATKNKEKLEKVFDNVKERAESEDITKSELDKLIEKTEALLKMLKSKRASL